MRYLLPCRDLFERAGAEVVVTARDDGATFRLLESERATFRAVGRQPGRRRRHKAVGLARRTRGLASYAREQGADLLFAASRPAALAARFLRLPIFFIGDYEYVSLAIQRLTRAFLLYPDVIAPEAWDIPPERLIPFRGIKEDLSLGEIVLDDYPPHRFAGVPSDVPLLLLRPPAEQSHYHREESTSFANELLAYLARQDSVQVVFTPRYPYQARALERHVWRRPPIVLGDPVHFVSLLRGVDLVVSSGGTMVREAAYLGIPAYSAYRGKVGAVDRYLESIGRLRIVGSAADFESIELAKGRRLPQLRVNPNLGEELVTEILTRASALRRAS